jgi:hypothetical protein
MSMKTYQRRHLRAPYREDLLFADGPYVLKARAQNISEGGLLLSEIPSFPAADEVPVLLAVTKIPSMKNFTLLKLQTFTREIFTRHVIRAKARMVRRQQLAGNLDNLFNVRIGLEFVRIDPADQRCLEEYVGNFAANLILLQTLVDSFNTDEETRLRARSLAQILGYGGTDRIAQLRTEVTADYKGLQWL